MKKVSLLLLAALLMLLPFAAMAQTDLAALENANTTMAIMDATRAARQHAVFITQRTAAKNSATIAIPRRRRTVPSMKRSAIPTAIGRFSTPKGVRAFMAAKDCPM